MDQILRVVLLILAILAVNGAVWAIILPIIRGKGRKQVEQYGSVPTAFGREPAEHEGKGSYVGTLVDGRKYYAPGYWARGMGPVKLTGHALHMLRGAAASPVLILRDGIRKVERRSRFAGRGRLSDCITVIHWEMGGGRFETGIIFSGGEDDRREWERRLAAPHGRARLRSSSC